MPFVYHDEEDMQEGWNAVEVFSKEDFEALNDQLEKMTEQRDQAIEQAESYHEELKEQKEKYATAFLNNAGKNTAKKKSSYTPLPQSYDSLFK